MKRAVEFLRKIKQKDDVIIIFNNDGDGICSGVLVEKILYEATGKRSYMIAQPMPPEKNLLRKIQSTLPTKIILTDMAIDQQPQLVRKLASLSDVLILDHHQLKKNMTSSNVVHYNPRMDDPRVYQSTSYIAYKICSMIKDMKDSLWVAAVGMVADYDLTCSQDVVEEIRKKFDIQGKLYDSWIGRIADMIEAARSTKTYTCEQMLEIIFSSKSEEEVLKNHAFLEAYKEVQNEIMVVLTDAETNSEIMDRIMFYNIKSKYNLSSFISTRLSEIYENRLIVVYQKAGSRIKVSARCQKGMNVGKIMENATEGIGSGGGHEAAAGATFDVQDWEVFRQNVIKLVK